MSFVSKLKDFVKTKLWYIVGTIVFIAISTGGFFGWKHYTFLQSPEHFLERLNLATQSNDFATLAALVDFRGISEDVAKHIVRAPIPPTPDKPRETNYIVMSEQIQKDFIVGMQNKDKEVKPNPNQTPLAPLEPLPADFVAQIAGKFKLETAVENEAIISVSVHYPRLKKDYKLLFSINKKDDWIVTRFRNIDVIIKDYIAEENKLEVLRDLKFQKDNAAIQARMNAQFSVKECTAFVHTASDGTSTLFVRINGYNNGPYIIRNMAFATTVTATTEQGNIEFNRNLNMAARLLPGVDLQDSYSVTLDPNVEQAAEILSAQSFSCTAKVSFMTLGNGQLLFTKKHRLAQ